MTAITLAVHHGGKLVYSSSMSYIKGEKTVFDNYDVDYLSVL